MVSKQNKKIVDFSNKGGSAIGEFSTTKKMKNNMGLKHLESSKKHVFKPCHYFCKPS